MKLMGEPRPPKPPEGYVGWPLWYHRACLVHNRLFGWLYILGLAGGAAWPGLRL
jgi:1,4-dihydroxy-2-naphthoate octaprenyltransferase